MNGEPQHTPIPFPFFAVPCYKRVKEMEYTEPETIVGAGGDDGDDWVATHNETGGTGFLHFCLHETLSDFTCSPFVEQEGTRRILRKLWAI